MDFRFGRIGLIAAGVAAMAVNLSAATYTAGDVFASLVGQVKEFSPTGTLVQTLSSGLTGFTTGSGFSSSGDFYVTDFSGGQVQKFANNAANTSTVFKSGFATPEDLLIDGAGNIFVSDLGGNGLQKFNSSGTKLAQYANPNRIDWFDLNSSESIMYYTDESGTIHRWNLSTNAAMADLCSACGTFALRLLGDGTLLAANNGNVERVNITTGAITQTYTTGVGSLFALNLDPDGKTFWTGSFANDDLYRVNIATGAIVNSFNTGTSGSNLYGVSVFGEITQVGGVPEPASIALFGTVLGIVSFSLRRKLKARS